MKKVGYAFYVHKSNLNELFNIVSEEERNHIVYVIDIAKLYLFLEFDIVKYDRKIIETSLIQAFCKIKHRENSVAYKELLKAAINSYENFQYKIFA